MCKFKNKITIIFLLAGLLINTAGITAYASNNDNISHKSSGVSEHELDIKSAVLSGDASFSADNSQGIKVNGNGSISLSFALDEKISAIIKIKYRADNSNNRKIEIGAKVNDTEYNLNSLTLPKIFENGEWKNPDEKPTQIVVSVFSESELRYNGYKSGEYLLFDFCKGNNKMTLYFEDQHLGISEIYLSELTSKQNYQTLSDLTDGTNEIVIEGEKAKYKSDPSLSPTYDLTSAQTYPYSYSKVLLNTIGASTWYMPGQWIEWEVPVDKSGYYKISMRVRQNTSRGMYSYRRISVDGDVLYNEFENYKFKYDRSWYVENLRNNNGEDMYIWLEKGTHILKMEAVMGDSINTYSVINEAVTELNSIYRKIIMITGSSPDTNRSYNLFSKITTLSEDFSRISCNLNNELARVEKRTNSVGTSISFLKQMSVQLENFSKDQDLIISALSVFKSNVSTLASQLTNLTNQPLEIDQIVLSQQSGKTLKATSILWESIIFSVKRFISSFFTDYSNISSNTGDDTKESLTVWVMMGRDQAQIIKNMANDTFTQEYGINTQISVITAGLSEAIMAGKGPDVVMGIDRTTAINLGVRKAFADLSTMESFGDIKSRFQKTTLVGYSYNGNIYALPNTQEYNMMFVRTDILKELGLEVCNTWNELFDQLSVFSQYQMTAGIPQTLINTLLVQSRMNYYTHDLKSTVFGTIEAYDVYEKFVKMFTDYESPITYDGANRFRSGEMPVVIAPFSFYNTLSILAPELNGLWDMYLIPGTVNENGEIDRSTEASGTASAVIEGSKLQEDGKAFLDWWTKTESQSRFGLEIENILGSSGRYATANVDAFKTLNWSHSQMTKIQEQRKWVNELPETPVSYIISRNMTNIFINVVENKANLRESLLKYSRTMNDEMTRKYKEIESYYAD